MEPTPRELEALKVLWDSDGGATVRDVCDQLSVNAGEEIAYTTILSLLQVMEQKGLVDHMRQGKAYVYRPLVERRKTLGQLASGFLETVFDGAVHEYLVHAIDQRRLSNDELAAIETMISEARSKQATSRKKQGTTAKAQKKKRGK